MFPITGSTATLAGQELAGVQLAADFVNADGGIDGRPIVLDVRDFQPGTDAAVTMASLKAAGAVAVIGAYASELSVPASQAASDAGLVYWEAGAVADRLTGRGLPLVFRVGASGSNLGTNSATFAATELASRLDKTVAQTRVAIVAASDDYPRSVAASATATATSAGLDIVANLSYEASAPIWAPVMAALADAQPGHPHPCLAYSRRRGVPAGDARRAPSGRRPDRFDDGRVRPRLRRRTRARRDRDLRLGSPDRGVPARRAECGCPRRV